ncbi:ECF RNA polymerase sigma factor SigF [Sideroxyarcus emersonii]|uniref:ECF RNA polymerase sigma factor SigF n=1 Tax=Sideroxyarcus emersonii TaxID=2764705 RepID=A0AAN1XC81_9PROT|nr:sigma-70 family RNA polymerase sigma factor [Sideroxyarcus emersonii]BCK88740.1 ECF RNA polymerase sigma factor SigF [Sideroxyarcus emersonii]
MSTMAGYYSPVYLTNGDQVTDSGDNLAALMQRSLGGDSQAYAMLLKETARLLRPFLLKRLYSSNEVDDVLQEILISVHKARHTYDGERPYKPWVYAIAKFRLQDHLRAHYADRLHDAEDLSELEEVLPDDAVEPGFDYESIRAEVARLPEKQATILQLMHHDGYTAREVAARTGMTESAVKVAAHRAYKVLRMRLER